MFVKHDGGKTRLDLLPTRALVRVAEVMEAGLAKYPPGNWRRVDRWSRYTAACLRHLFAWMAGEDKDPETGLSHLAHAACCVLFLVELEDAQLGEDDRWTKEEREEEP